MSESSEKMPDHGAGGREGGQIPATDGSGTGEQSDRGRAEGEDDDDRKEGGGDLLGRDDSAQKDESLKPQLLENKHQLDCYVRVIGEDAGSRRRRQGTEPDCGPVGSGAGGHESGRGRAEGEDDDGRKKGGGDLPERDGGNAQKEIIAFNEIGASLKESRHEGDAIFANGHIPDIKCGRRSRKRTSRKLVKLLGRPKGEKEKGTNLTKEINVVKKIDPADSSQPR
ncbi:hypothetical protein AXF42_Ash010647 [Apostasia shenzhenica]|uniref:Uncharacterized protein n=1 Tax=Apostasia shenzhenica TaxID=1088818 RepID=A0A2I0A6P5_9ASPA|nr:hypothetical protein AXF42_Ash010647 [Apostasia shenzhenica]